MAIRYAASDKQFGSVFKEALHGGPRTERSYRRPLPAIPGGIAPAPRPLQPDLLNGRLPTWQDRREPGNTNANESAEQILRGWDDKKMQRFDVFMSQFYRNLTPWKKEYLDKSTSDFTKPDVQILKCKIELIKRLLKIKVVGPESLEDWCLLFMYYENDLAIPKDIEQLLRPETSKLEIQQFAERLPLPERRQSYFIAPPETALENMSNVPMIGFGSRQRRENRPLVKRTALPVIDPDLPNFTRTIYEFPRYSDPVHAGFHPMIRRQNLLEIQPFY